MQTSRNASEIPNYESIFLALSQGRIKRFVPLNYGSEERRNIKIDYKEKAEKYQIPYKMNSSSIEIGGYVPLNKRGWRYVIWKDESLWLNWRKAKKLRRRS